MILWHITTCVLISNGNHTHAGIITRNMSWGKIHQQLARLPGIKPTSVQCYFTTWRTEPTEVADGTRLRVINVHIIYQ